MQERKACALPKAHDDDGGAKPRAKRAVATKKPTTKPAAKPATKPATKKPAKKSS